MIMTTVKSDSFLTFVYPITLESGDFDQVVEAVDAVEIADGGWKIWERAKFPHEELLPHVADYLNPKDDQLPTARLWEMSNDALASTKGLGSKADWHLVIGKDREVAFKFECINLFLFRVGIGFLAFRVIPKSNDLGDWLDLLHYFRYAKQSQVGLTARRKTGRDSFEDFFPPFAVPDSVKRKSKDKDDENKNTLSLIIHGLFKMIGDERDLPENWWDEIFIHNQTLGYAALFIENHPAGEDFNLLYRLRNFFQSSGKKIYPSPFDLSPQHTSLLECGNRQWFTFSLDGGSFLACDAPDTEFFNVTLPVHIRDQYFHLYIIALHQRFALMSMSHEVAEKWLAKTEAERIEAFERIRNRFLSFTARGYFAQVMQREHHHRCYRKWQETFELQRIYDEVREEVREMFEWLQLNRAKRMEIAAKRQSELIKQETVKADYREKMAKERAEKFERRVSLFGLLITLGIGIPALVTGFFGMNMTEPPENFTFGLMTAIIWFFGAVVTSVSIALILYFYMNRHQESDESKTQKVEITLPEQRADNEECEDSENIVVIRSYGRKIN